MSEHPAPAGAPPEPADEPVGTALRMAREAAGLGLEETARRLKFAPRQLDALERGEWARLPGGGAVRSMVRQYARLLELDADLLVERAGRGEPLPEQLAQRFQQPIPFSDGSRRSNLAYVALSLVLLAVVAAVGYQWREERANRSRLNFVSAAQQPAEPARATLASAAREQPPRPCPRLCPRPCPRLCPRRKRPPDRKAASSCASRRNRGWRSTARRASSSCRICIRPGRNGR